MSRLRAVLAAVLDAQPGTGLDDIARRLELSRDEVDAMVEYWVRRGVLSVQRLRGCPGGACGTPRGAGSGAGAAGGCPASGTGCPAGGGSASGGPLGGGSAGDGTVGGAPGPGGPPVLLVIGKFQNRS